MLGNYSNLFCIRKYYSNNYGSRRKYAYLHEEEPNSPLESSVKEDVPIPNSENIPFVSLNEVGNHAGIHALDDIKYDKEDAVVIVIIIMMMVMLKVATVPEYSLCFENNFEMRLCSTTYT